MRVVRPYSPGAGSGPWRWGSVGLKPAKLAAALGSAALLLMISGAREAALSTPSGLSSPIVLTQVPARSGNSAARAEGLLREEMGEGGRLVLVPPGGRPKVLTTGFASAADPEVSFDGRRILFSGRKTASDPWCLYEMVADGSDVRPVTCGPGSARHGVYLPPMHTLTPTSTEVWVLAAFVGGRRGEVNEAGVGEARSLYACRLDGSALRRLTFNLSSDLDPALLPDGRLVYASWQLPTLEHGPQGRFVLLAANVDGTDFVPFSADEGRRVKQMPAATADGLLVFVEADAIAGDGAGRLASVTLRRPLHSHRAITREADGWFHSPSPLPGGEVLVSARPAAGGGDHAVYRLDPATGRREKIFDDPGWHDVQAKLLAPRQVPDSRSSPIQESDESGKLYAVDVGISDLPAGSIPRGTPMRLRVLEGLPRPEGGPVTSPLAARRLLGEAPVAEDGSFQVVVPANVPVQLQLLDEDGLALRSGAWIWTRNHFNQGCVGCHEDPERTPPNRFVKALASPAPQLTLLPALRRTVDYLHDVTPIVAGRCVGCHGKGGTPPDLRPGSGSAGDGPATEAPSPAYMELLDGFVQPGRARASRLVWHLFGRNTSRPWDPEAASREIHPMPEGRPPLTDEERRTIVEWIDMGAAWDATSAIARPESAASPPQGATAAPPAAPPAATGEQR